MAVDVLPWVLLVIAAGFAVVTGANDGGVLVAMAVRYSIVPVGVFAGILFAVLVAGPLLLGVTVARTLTDGLVTGDGTDSSLSFAIGVLVALLVVAVLSRWGLPTSLTLALIGGLAGAGWGLGLDVDWGRVAAVLAVGAAAPVVGGTAGWCLDRLARVVPPWRRTGGAVRRMHLVAFVVQCLAYAINDGQKMLAVAAVALVGLPGGVLLLSGPATGWLVLTLASCAVLFSVGTLWTLRKVSTRLALDLVQIRPLDAVAAELAAGGAVLASSALGAPVSMTQSLAAGLIGVAGSKGVRRVRWKSATTIGAAWLVTLPAAFLAALGIAGALGATGVVTG